MVAFRLSFRNTLVGIGRVVSLLLGTNRLRKAPINNLSGNGLRTRPMARVAKGANQCTCIPLSFNYDRTITGKNYSILTTSVRFYAHFWRYTV